MIVLTWSLISEGVCLWLRILSPETAMTLHPDLCSEKPDLPGNIIDRIQFTRFCNCTGLGLRSIEGEWQ
jgi:hypothetical protein